MWPIPTGSNVVNPRDITALMLERMKCVVSSTFRASHAEYPADEKCETSPGRSHYRSRDKGEMIRTYGKRALSGSSVHSLNCSNFLKPVVLSNMLPASVLVLPEDECGRSQKSGGVEITWGALVARARPGRARLLSQSTLTASSTLVPPSNHLFVRYSSTTMAPPTLRFGF